MPHGGLVEQILDVRLGVVRRNREAGVGCRRQPTGLAGENEHVSARGAHFAAGPHPLVAAVSADHQQKVARGGGRETG